MKKKITRFLLLAMTIVGVGVFSSCKDYEEDQYNKVQAGQVTLQVEYDALKDKVAELENKLNQINSCNCDNSDSRIQNVIEQYFQDAFNGSNSMADDLAQYITTIINNNTTPSMTEEQVRTIVNEMIEGLNKCNCQEITKDVVIAWVEELLCHCENLKKEDIMAWIAEEIAKNPHLTADDVKAIVLGMDDVIVMHNELDEAIAKLASIEYVDGKFATKAELNQAIIDLETKIIEAKNLAQDALDLANENKTAIEGLQTVVGEMQTTINNINTTVTNLVNKVDSVQTLANSNKERIDIIESSIEAMQTAIEARPDRDEVNSMLDSLSQEIAKTYATKEELKAVEDKVDALREYVDSLVQVEIAAVNERIDGVETTIAELEKAYKAADQALQDQIDAIDGRLSDVEAEVAEVKTKLDEVIGRVDKLEDALSKLVTGITVQQVYNPAIGSFNTPVGVNSNILIAYYGQADKTVAFPSKLSGVSPIYEVAAGEKILDGEGYATAGKVYMTINPSDVDFSNLPVALVNSLDEESPVKLAPIQPSDKKLTFGYTRAGNGFYEAEAQVAEADIEAARLKIDNKRAIASALKNLVKERTASGLKVSGKELASELFTAAQGLQLDALGLKTSWSDAYGDHSVTSNYGIAATAVNPLSFHSLDKLEGMNVGKIFGYAQVSNFINSIAKKAKKSMKFKIHGQVFDDLKNLNIHGIDIKDLSEEQLADFVVRLDTTIVLDGLTYHLNLSQDVDVPVKFTKDVTVPVHIDKEVEIDLNDAEIQQPTVVITTDLKNNNGTATLEVPVVDENGDTVGVGEVNLGDVEVIANADVSDIVFNGTVVAHIVDDVDATAHIEVDETVSATVNIDRWINFGNYSWDDALQKYVEDENGTVRLVNLHIEYDMRDAATSLWGIVKDQMNGVNDMLEDLSTLVDDANDFINKLDNQIQDAVDTAVNTFTDEAYKYLDKINNLYQKYGNKALHFIPRLTKPALIVNSPAGLSTAGIESKPAIASGSTVTIWATTYSAEILCPVAKKYVDYRKVGDASFTKVELSDNGTAELNGLTPGKYEVRYAALDYHGNEISNSYFISVK